MADLNTGQIRNVALAAHNGAGKTSLPMPCILRLAARPGRARSTTRQAFPTMNLKSSVVARASNWQFCPAPGANTELTFSTPRVTPIFAAI